MTKNPDRGAAQRYAAANGYFWMPCPRCGAYFGGHEWDDANNFPCRRDPLTCHGACCPKVSDVEDAAACARGHDRDTVAVVLAKTIGISVTEASVSLHTALAQLPQVRSSVLFRLSLEAGLTTEERTRASFAYGNCKLANALVTEEMVIEAILKTRS